MTNQTKYIELFNELKCCVIVPTYNNDQTLQKVIEGIRAYTDNIIIVNDGSTDYTQSILDQSSVLHQITFDKNRGKGSALQAGFKLALDLKYDYAITIDSDGQHSPDDLPAFIEMLKENPESLIVGNRNMMQEGVPGKSSFGHKFSNFWYAIETGIKLPDTQSGYRLYPLQGIKHINFFTRKFEFEIEILVRSAWHNIPVISVPVNVKYFPKNVRVSHFRPIIDFTRISILNTILVLLALLWIKPIQVIKSLSKENIKNFISEQIRKNTESNMRLSFAIALGIFCGIIPAWGWQMIIAVPLAHLFRLNKIIVLTASNISIPPMIPFILYASYVTGGYLLSKQSSSVNMNHFMSFDFIRHELMQYIIGSFALAVIASATIFLLSYIFFMIFRKRYR